MDKSWFAEYLSMLHDPAHWLFEMTTAAVFDFLIGYVGWQVVGKKFIIPRLKKQFHEEYDREHNVEHTPKE